MVWLGSPLTSCVRLVLSGGVWVIGRGCRCRVMGTFVRMIERHYGALLDGAGADIADRLDALDLDPDRADTERSEDANEV